MRPPAFDPAWPPDVVALYRHDLQEIWDRNIARHIWNQYHNQLDLYLAQVAGYPKLDILDIGCAQGTLALLLAERGHRVWAMDIRPAFLTYAASRHEIGDIKFVCGNAMDAVLDRQFDLVFANQILEHLVYPLEFLGRVRGYVKPGGRVVMTTPNWAYAKNPLPSFDEVGDPKELEHRQFTADGDGHFFAYRSEELSRLFHGARFTDVEVSCFESPWISGHMKVRHLHGVLPVAFLRFLDRATLSVPALGCRLAHQLMVQAKRP